MSPGLPEHAARDGVASGFPLHYQTNQIQIGFSNDGCGLVSDTAEDCDEVSECAELGFVSIANQTARVVSDKCHSAVHAAVRQYGRRRSHRPTAFLPNREGRTRGSSATLGR